MTQVEFQELKIALSQVSFDTPIKKYADDAYGDDDLRKLLTYMKERMDADPSLYNDKYWMDEYDQLQRIADYRGIAV